MMIMIILSIVGRELKSQVVDIIYRERMQSEIFSWRYEHSILTYKSNVVVGRC